MLFFIFSLVFCSKAFDYVRCNSIDVEIFVFENSFFEKGWNQDRCSFLYLEILRVKETLMNYTDEIVKAVVISVVSEILFVQKLF